MGGFGIEITVGAPTLAQTHEMVLASGLLEPAFWLYPPEQHAA